MTSLTEKYRPKRIRDFAGLARAKAIMGKLVASPYPSAWLFCGGPGQGKTTMGLALAAELNAELHHIPARTCTLETIQHVCDSCHTYPGFLTPGAEFHLVLIDEVDEATRAAQIALLSRLDATGFPPSTIFVFTCNGTGKLEERFLSRCRVIQFDVTPESKEAANFLFGVWYSESRGNTAGAPIMRDLIADNGGNIRGALMALEMELSFVELAA